MTFLVPLGLLGLLVLPLIILLHLVRQRQRNVVVPSLELWEVRPAPVERRPRRLPLTLLLLLHLLAAALLGLSLGRPLLPGALFEPTNTIVVLDTSTSMAAAAAAPGGATRFDAARTAAEQIFTAARPGESIGLIALGAPPRLLGHGGPEAAGTLLRAMQDLQPAGPDGDLSSALSLATVVAEGQSQRNMRNRVVVLTDPSFGQPAATTAPITVTGELDWRIFGDPADNVAIVAFAARPLRAGRQQLYARVANFGDRPATRSLAIVLDGNTVQTEPVRLDGGAETEWSWPLPHGAQIAEARLSPSDLLSADDGASAVLSGGASLRVELVSDAPTPLERALRAQPGVEVTLATPASYRHDPAADVAVLIGFVPESLPPVPTLLVAPPRENRIIPVTDMLRDLRAAGAPDGRFAAIDLRSIRFDSAAAVETPAWATVALAAGDAPLVLTGVLENQPRTIWTFDPASSNLSGRLAFPLLTAATLRTLLPESGSMLQLGYPAPEPLIAPDGATVPAGTILAERGNYRLAERQGTVAVNALDAAESDLRQRPKPAVHTPTLAEAVRVRENGRELWRVLLAGALGLVVLEWLYIHRHDLRRRPPSRPISRRNARGNFRRRRVA